MHIALGERGTSGSFVKVTHSMAREVPVIVGVGVRLVQGCVRVA